MLDRINAIIARHGTTPSGDPYTFHHGTRMLLEQLDEYLPETPCRVISEAELREIAKTLEPQ